MKPRYLPYAYFLTMCQNLNIKEFEVKSCKTQVCNSLLRYTHLDSGIYFKKKGTVSFLTKLGVFLLVF